MYSTVTTISELLRARVGDHHLGLVFEDERYTWDEIVTASAARAALAGQRRGDGPFHVGVLLDNVPEYLFWLGAAALCGATVVGINPTRRGEELARDIRHTDCALLVTDQAGRATLETVDHGIDPDRVLVVDDPAYGAALAPFAGAALPDRDPDPRTTFLLLFTSGTTGAPKAVICSQARLAGIIDNVIAQYGIVRDDVTYQAMPMFHGNAIMVNIGPALKTGATIVLRRRFSARGFLSDIRAHGCTFFNYVGKCLTYILATPASPLDADNRLTRCFGNEASATDIAAFEARFGCRIVEGYGSSEGGAVIARTPETPPDALGVGRTDSIVVVDPDTGRECRRARFDERGRLANAAEAIGEIVNRNGAPGFEGYYNNPEADAERVRADGWYWTGDLAYRDEAGFFYFAGRGADWLRVDGENFAAAPVERILWRAPGVVAAAVYAVPDALAGDQVMAAIELAPGERFDAAAFAAHLEGAPDLGTKWAPRYVRIVAEMPLTGSHKILKTGMRRQRWECDDPVWFRPGRDLTYRPLDADDVAAIRADFEHHGRAALLDL